MANTSTPPASLPLTVFDDASSISNTALQLPQVGMSRWAQLRHFIPVSRETWRQLVMSGRAPQPIRLSERCSMWPNAQIHSWLADPANYRA